MKEQVYHIVITKYCDHDCPLCCNKFYDLDRLPTVTGDNLREANTVCLTGGEPFVLLPDTISGLSKALKEQYPNIQRIYVYTSGLRLGGFVGKEIGYMYRFIDGIPLNIRNAYLQTAPITAMPATISENTHRCSIHQTMNIL